MEKMFRKVLSCESCSFNIKIKRNESKYSFEENLICPDCNNTLKNDINKLEWLEQNRDDICFFCKRKLNKKNYVRVNLLGNFHPKCAADFDLITQKKYDYFVKNEKSNIIYVENNKFLTLKAMIRLHFLMDQPHIEKNMQKIIQLIDNIENDYNISIENKII